MEELGIDFEEGFSDDEDINFGMDDQEEAKEAKKTGLVRQHTKPILI